MGKKILRAAMGVIFLFVFLAFLLTSAVKFRLISSDFWKTALVKGKVYEQLQVKIKQMGVELEKETRKQSQTVPKELQTLVNLEKQLDETRLRELVETNIERLIGYVTGETAELKLYLPITEWKLPVARLGQPGLAKLNAETPVGEVLGSLGFKEEQTKQVTEKLVQTRKIVMGLTEVWLILLVLTIGLLLLHFSLGEGMADRVWGTGLLLIVVGLLVKLIGVGAGQIFELM